MIDVARARTETPGVENRIHFNNCGAALMPAPVLEAVKDHLDLEGRIGGYEAAAQEAPALRRTYEAISRLLNCSPDEVAVVENATRGWDMVFYALGFQPGDRILTSSAEYASNFLAYLQVARRTGAVVGVLPDDEYGQLDVEALDRAIDPRTKLISVTHVPTNGGLVNPAASIGRVARAHGVPFLLDACQAAGQLPLDVEQMGVDMLTATSRKYLRGPRGVGFLYVRRPWIEKIEPPFLDLHAARWIGTDHFEIRADATRFENWECNIAGKIGLGIAVEYAMGWGIDSIRQRVSWLADDLRSRLSDLPGVTVQDRGQVRCGIVSFTCEDVAASEVVAGLAKSKINTSVSRAEFTLLDMTKRGLDAVVRAGLHYYNTEQEIKKFIAALRGVLGGGRRGT